MKTTAVGAATSINKGMIESFSPNPRRKVPKSDKRGEGHLQETFDLHVGLSRPRPGRPRLEQPADSSVPTSSHRVAGGRREFPAPARRGTPGRVRRRRGGY